MTQPITLAQIGCGYWGPNLLRNFSSLPDAKLKWLVDANPAVQQSMREKMPGLLTTGNAAEVFADPAVQAVVIATPAVTHYELAKTALLAGKDVFVEKPMALHRTEGEELVKLAAQQNRVLMVGHILQFHPAVVKLKQMIDAGELGRIQYVYSNRLNIGKIRSEENILWSFAPHDISVMLMLLGEMPVAVNAHGGNYLHQHLPDVTMTTLTFASGARGHIFVSWLHPVKEQKLVIVGDKKMAVFNDAAPKEKLVTYAHQVEWIDRRPVAKKAEAETVAITADEPLRLECAHFLESIRTRQSPRTDGREGLRVLSVLEACQTSLDRQGALVPLSAPTVAPAKTYFAHESAYVDEPSTIGDGTKIWHFTHVLKGTTLGKNCNIGQNCVIGPDVAIGNNVKIQNNVSVYKGVTLEDDVFCGPSMVFTNVNNPRSAIRRMDEIRKTVVKRGASIGANATIVCGHDIGVHAFIGAGAVVTKDVPDFALVVGNPGKVIGWMCRCGTRLAFTGNSAACAACGEKYQKTGNTIQPQ